MEACLARVAQVLLQKRLALLCAQLGLALLAGLVAGGGVQLRAVAIRLHRRRCA